MVLFTKEFITNYRNDPGIKRMLGGVVLLNRDEFFQWYMEDLRKTSRKIVIPKKYVDGGVNSPPAWFTKEMSPGPEPYRPKLTQPPTAPVTSAPPGFIPNAPGFGTGPPNVVPPPPPITLSKAPRRQVTAKRGNYPSRRRTARSARTTKDVFRFIKEADRIKEEQKQQLAQIANNTFREIAAEVCDPTIGRDYARTSLINITKFFEFDFLVAVTPDYNKQPPMMNYEKQQVYKRSKILGFLIAEKGECKKLPNTYSVNLICVQKNPVLVGAKKYTVKGTILLGAFLYCIKCHDGILEELEEGEPRVPIDQQGILELAGAYENLEGFFAYSKLGFKKDISLLVHQYAPNNERCFYDSTLLPMIAPMTQFYSPKHVIQRVTGELRMSVTELVENDETGLIQTGLPNTIPENEEQKNLQKKIAEDAYKHYTMETDIHLGNILDDEDMEYNKRLMADYYKRIQENLKRYLRIRAGLSEYSPDTASTETENTGSQMSGVSSDNNLDMHSQQLQSKYMTKIKAKKRSRSKSNSRAKSKKMKPSPKSIGL